jgi:hypothetical protein
MAHYPVNHQPRQTYRLLAAAAAAGRYFLVAGVIGLARTWGDPYRIFRVSRVGLASRWDRPFQARFTRCAATISFFGLRASRHH